MDFVQCDPIGHIFADWATFESIWGFLEKDKVALKMATFWATLLLKQFSYIFTQITSLYI